MVAAIVQELALLVFCFAYEAMTSTGSVLHVITFLTILTPLFIWVGFAKESLANQAGKAFHESERLRSTFSAFAEGIILQNSKGVIVECNPPAERILASEENWTDYSGRNHEFIDTIRRNGDRKPMVNWPWQH